MHDIHATPTVPAAGRRPSRHPLLRWAVTFAGFPVGAVAAGLVAGPIDTTTAAAVGGLITGAVLGLVQAWAMRPAGPSLASWTAATALGLMVGLTIGASAVGFGTDLAALVTQGALCGLAVGSAQAVVLRSRLGWLAAGWPVGLAGAWALGWAITTSIGVEVGDQFTVFGSSGALVVTGLTAVLPLTLSRRAGGAS